MTSIVENQSTSLTHKSFISGSSLPSTYVDRPASKLTNFQHRILLKNIGNLWPPDSLACSVSSSDLQHIDSKIKWFKGWMKGLCYLPQKHSHVDVQKSLNWLWTNKKYAHRRKLQRVRQQTGLSTRCMKAWLKWKQAELCQDLQRKMLCHIFHEDRYPNSCTIKALSIHTSLSASDISLWFLVARVLDDAIDNHRAEKDEMILWRMFEHCKTVGQVQDKDVDLISDLLDMDSAAVYKIFQHWCYIHNVASLMTAQKYLVVEDWFQMFESPTSKNIALSPSDQPEKAGSSKQQTPFSAGVLPQYNVSSSSKFSSTKNSCSNFTLTPSTQDGCHQHQQCHKIPGSLPPKLSSVNVKENLLSRCEVISENDESGLSPGDPAMVLFSEHFHHYVRKQLKKMRRSQSKSGIPKKAVVINRNVRKKCNKKPKGGSKYPSFHKQDDPDVQFVACLKPGKIKCREEGSMKPAQPLDLNLFEKSSLPTDIAIRDLDSPSEAVDALYDVLNNSDEEEESDSETEIITIDSDSDNNQEQSYILPSTSKSEDNLPTSHDSPPSLNEQSESNEESDSCSDLFYLFQTPKRIETTSSTQEEQLLDT
uniref:Uncharacterized protein LOC100184831 n=1 Tax=Phallusia mammillata TaxID=59560 RepID=A0A6F9DHG6_9ASCI|nr:uncharacterized protein LOC100184831 [Phallusia mammillata]